MAKASRSARDVECCLNCRYYQEFEDLDEEDAKDPENLTGVCRRYPPLMFASVPMAASAYPEVSGLQGWCGEYTPKS